MSEDNVRHLWSDAELDEALAALHPHGPASQAEWTELDRGRARMLRAADAIGEQDTLPGRPRRRRAGAWRWIAVAASVVLMTGSIVVAREINNAPNRVTDVAPAGTEVPQPSAPAPEPGAPFTHVVNKYSVLEWVEGRSAFLAPEQVDLWIPADRTQVWKRRWTRDGSAKFLTGRRSDQTRLTGPATLEQSARGGRFTADFPHPGGTTAGGPAGWFKPTPEFLAGLPADPAQLAGRMIMDRTQSQAGTGYPPLAEPRNYGGPPRPASQVRYPGITEMVLVALASGQASLPLRSALVKTMSMPGTGFVRPTSAARPGTAELASVDGQYRVRVTVDQTTMQLVDLQVVSETVATGAEPGTVLSSAQFSFGETTQAQE